MFENVQLIFLFLTPQIATSNTSSKIGLLNQINPFISLMYKFHIFLSNSKNKLFIYFFFIYSIIFNEKQDYSDFSKVVVEIKLYQLQYILEFFSQ
jgi:hypothetical protein